jgi:hypothetical protein
MRGLVCGVCGDEVITFEDPDYIRVVNGRLDLGISKPQKCFICQMAEEEGVNRETIIQRLTEEGYIR